MGSREILTLQFGHYSNFIGAHWWNIQELGFDYNSTSEINHDVLFREGVTEHKEITFTPRLLLVDLKGSLKSLHEKGDLYEPLPDPAKTNTEWDEDLLEIRKDPPGEKNKFQKDLRNIAESSKVINKFYDFDEDVEVWSDFLYTRFHPRSVNIVKEYQHCNEKTPFDIFPTGTSLWKTPHFEDDFSDKIRNYVEECDHFQGFHMLTDGTDAFSGLAASCLEYLVDEYERKSILVIPSIPSYFVDDNFETDEEKHRSILKQSYRVLNLALGFNAFNKHSSLFVPLCTGRNGWRQPIPKREFYHIKYNHELPYHTSAILASALDTFTLKHRLKSSNFSLVDLCADLNKNGRKAAAASVCLPFSINVDADLIDCLDNWEGPLSQCITPNCTIGTDRVMQHITLRGIPEDRLKRPANQAGKQRDLPAYRCNSITEMMNLYLSYTTDATASMVTVVNNAVSVRTPYPKIFDEFVGPNGNVNGKPRPGNINVESVPVLAGLHSGSGICDMLESLHTEARKIKFPRFHQYISGGIEKDEFEECLDDLFTLRENYEDTYLI